MLDNGASIRFIQQIRGHVSIGTTGIYTHMSIVKLKQIHEMTPTLHQKQVLECEPDATAEGLLATQETESDNKE